MEVDAAQRRLEAVDKAIGNLVRALELGGDQILSVTARLTELQDEKAALERRLVAAKEADGTHIEMPPDEWIRAQLADLATLLRQNTQQSGLVLRKIVDKVVVRPVLPAGKRRGYGQLRFRIRSWSVLAQVLNGKVSQFALDAACAVGDDGPEFHIDIGGPTRMDRWGPEVVRMRAEGITWKEITRITGLKAANAAVAMKRWLDAQEPPDKTAQQF